MTEKEFIDDRIEEPSIGYLSNATYADYLKAGVDEVFGIIRGQVMKTSPGGGSSHQRVNSNLHGQIFICLKGHSCQVFHPPYDVILPIKNESKNQASTVVQPDICVICNLDLIEERGCFGPPDLVVEIISPRSTKRDLVDKYSIYEEVGVREYWIVYPKEQRITVFNNQDGFVNIAQLKPGDEFTSAALPAININVKDVFAGAQY